MTDEKSTRRELMRPAQLLSIAVVAALFAGFVTAMSMGLFQGKDVWTFTLVMTGGSFIVVLLGLSMLLLAVKPEQISHVVDRPVLFDKEDPADETPLT